MQELVVRNCTTSLRFVHIYSLSMHAQLCMVVIHTKIMSAGHMGRDGSWCMLRHAPTWGSWASATTWIHRTNTGRSIYRGNNKFLWVRPHRHDREFNSRIFRKWAYITYSNAGWARDTSRGRGVVARPRDAWTQCSEPLVTFRTQTEKTAQPSSCQQLAILLPIYHYVLHLFLSM